LTLVQNMQTLGQLFKPLYKETPEFGPNFIPQPSELIDGEEDYEVETICAHRGSPGQRQYLVSWKGYSCAEDT